MTFGTYCCMRPQKCTEQVFGQLFISSGGIKANKSSEVVTNLWMQKTCTMHQRVSEKVFLACSKALRQNHFSQLNTKSWDLKTQRCKFSICSQAIAAKRFYRLVLNSQHQLEAKNKQLFSQLYYKTRLIWLIIIFCISQTITFIFGFNSLVKITTLLSVG